MNIASRTGVLAAVVLAAAASLAGQPAPEPALPAGVQRAYRALSPRVHGTAAMDVVAFMSRYWRVAGNPGYNASIDYIRTGLAKAGFSDGRLRVDEFANRNPGWDYTVGTITIAGEPTEVILSRERDRVSLCINSFSTPEGGLTAALVDVGAGTAADFEGREVRGAVVLGDAPLGRLWQQAVRTRGAAGVISTAIAPYIRPSDPAQFTREEQHDVLQWGSVPYDPEARAFGFKASSRAASRVRERLQQGPLRVRVDIQSSFYTGSNRSLVAGIAGRTRPDERIVMVAHVQEPGANDNASGSGTFTPCAPWRMRLPRGRWTRRNAPSRSCGWTKSAAAASGWRRGPTKPEACNTCSPST